MSLNISNTIAGLDAWFILASRTLIATVIVFTLILPRYKNSH